MKQQMQTILKDVFGYDQFRPLQKEIIENALNKRDTLVIMPTGGGKSLCYQIPALMFEGLTVVVSPLISLMKDQVEQLTESGVKATLLNSSLSQEQYKTNLSSLLRREAKLLYVAPETLLKPNILTMLTDNLKVDCLTIDEAHCISEWGHDFRPEYRQIGELRTRFQDAVCMALTATATPRVQDDISSSLNFDHSNKFIASFNRENLFVDVVEKNDPVRQLLNFLARFKNQSGIIYCFSRRQVDDLTEFLAEENFSVCRYHAGLADQERAENQERFIRDDVQIVVATIAFGMGINKPNVRFVVHYDLPKNLESYYQEIGRAGRDGLKSNCLLLFGYGDIQKIQFFFKEKEGRELQMARNHLNAMIAYAESHVCRRKPLLKYFGEDFTKENCGMCDNCTTTRDYSDLTVPAQKFLSCIYRTGQFFGANHIIDVLRGSRSEKVLSRGHGNLSTYGIGKDYTKRQWLHLSRQLVQQDVLFKDEEFGSLKLTEKAMLILRGQEAFQGTVDDTESRRPSAIETASLDYDMDLFNILRNKRKSLADRAQIPPYAVFADKTLIEMATYFPINKESMLTMHGVGLAKFEKYGTIFQNEIYRYCKENDVKPKSKIGTRHRSAQRKLTLRKPRYIEVGEKYQASFSIEAIMGEYGVKQSTVVNHLFKFVRDGNTLNPKPFQKLSNLPEDRQQDVMAAFDRLGADALRPIYDYLGESVDYDELSILRLCYICKISPNE